MKLTRLIQLPALARRRAMAKANPAQAVVPVTAVDAAGPSTSDSAAFVEALAHAPGARTALTSPDDTMAQRRARSAPPDDPRRALCMSRGGAEAARRAARSYGVAQALRHSRRPIKDIRT